MGGVQSADVNRVDIMTEGCGGNAGWLFGARYSPDAMDQRLAPYLTMDEYQAGINVANIKLATLGRSTQIVCVICLAALGILSGVGAILGGLHEPAFDQCAAPNGECQPGQTEAANQCCSWNCCPLNMGVASGGCNQIGKTTEQDCECTTTGSGKQRKTTCKEVKLSGTIQTVPEENGWAAVAAMLCTGLAIAFVFLNLGQCLFRQCSISGLMRNALDPWTKKGLYVSYFGGSKHSRSRIMVTVPQTGIQPIGAPVAGSIVAMPPAVQVGSSEQQPVPGAVVGAPPTMQVQVPAGSGPGSTVQMQAPNGQTMQVQVPEGYEAGSIFTVQY